MDNITVKLVFLIVLTCMKFSAQINEGAVDYESLYVNDLIFNFYVYSATGDNWTVVDEVYVLEEQGWVEPNASQGKFIIGTGTIFAHPDYYSVVAATVGEIKIPCLSSVSFGLGLNEGAAYGNVNFVIQVEEDGVYTTIFERVVTEDNVIYEYEIDVDLPYTGTPYTLRFITDPNGSSTQDWAKWTNLKLTFPKSDIDYLQFADNYSGVNITEGIYTFQSVLENSYLASDGSIDAIALSSATSSAELLVIKNRKNFSMYNIVTKDMSYVLYGYNGTTALFRTYRDANNYQDDDEALLTFQPIGNYYYLHTNILSSTEHKTWRTFNCKSASDIGMGDIPNNNKYWWEATRLGDLPPSLNVVVKNIEGINSDIPKANGKVVMRLPMGEVRTKTTNSEGVALFEDLFKATGYTLKVFHNGDSPWGEEYWGEETVNIEEGWNSINFIRSAPYVKEVSFRDKSGNVLLKENHVVSGDNNILSIELASEGEYSVKPILILDRDKELPYDYQSSFDGFGDLSSNLLLEYICNFSLLDTGKYFYCVTAFTSGYGTTDGWAWNDAFSVWPESDIISQKLDVDNVVGIFPNPAKSYLKLSADQLYSIMLFDLSGNLHLTEKMKSLDCELNLSSFTPGVYLLYLTNETSEIVKKVVIE